MIITCSKCETSFNLNENLLKPSGSKVRCSKCKYVFIAYPPEPLEEPAQVLREEPRIAGFDVDTSAEDDVEKIKENDALPDDLDFSGDENFFEIEKDAPEELEVGDLDFSLEMDSDDTEDETDAGDGLGELSELELPDSDDSFESDSDQFGDLDFSLESESDKETQDAESVEDSGDIDLSELEKMLDLDGMPDTKEPGPETETDEFKFDLEPEKTADTIADAGEQAEISAEELDLSDIEKMLEIDEPETIAGSEHEDEDLEFDFELEPDQMIDSEESKIEFEPDELDLSDLQDVLEEDQVPETGAETDDTDLELDLDFSLEEDEADAGEISDMEISEVSEPKDRLQPDFAIGGEEESADLAEMAQKEAELVKTFEMGGPERETETEEMETFSEAGEHDERGDGLPPVPAKKGVSLPLIVLLILALLAGGVYFVYTYTDIKIPYLSEMQTPEVQDSGGLKMTTFGISSRFVENEHAGRFFVITGKVKNGYADARSFIKIRGKLYSKGKKLENAQAVFCGNLLTNTELAELDVEAIKKRLSNRSGDNQSNVNVPPGKILPFMVVFTELPDNLEEYTIEVTGSVAL
ncbi:MAG: hypothetical protein B6I22_08940 [Desulfobacteraceae bacterium 4572_123]|nr:MAG: hypothetical protein B6I22_08940 [Desulfobacteraceae bacterium 4572_123]